MKKNKFFEVEGFEYSWRDILNQIGFGAILGAMFFGLIYLGGLLANLVSGV